MNRPGRATTGRRLLTGAGVAGLAALAALPAGRRAAARWRALQEVSPELRGSPIVVALPLVPASDRSVGWIQRLSSMVRLDLPPGARRDTAPGRDGQPDVPVIVYPPPPAATSAPTGALLWVHGGGRVIGSADQDHAVCTQLAQEAGVTVVSVDYRLAPEHPFPAALDDVTTALGWLRSHASELGIDPARIAVGGASAGGGLAAEVAQRAHDEGVPLALQLLVYPMLDDRTLPGTVTMGRDRPWWTWTPQQNRYAWSAYLGHPAGEAEDRRYAVAARRADLSGLAPAWIGVGGLDLFLDEARDYARRLEEAGVPVELHVEPGMPHGADQGASETPSMRAFRARAATALRDAVGADALVAGPGD